MRFTLGCALVISVAASPVASLAQARALPMQARTGVFDRHAAQAREGTASDPATSFSFGLVDYPGAGANQEPTGMNDNGKVVGFYNISDTVANGYSLQGTTFRPIVYPAAVITVPFGVNPGGTVVGTYSIDAVNFHGMILRGNSYTTLDYPNGLNTAAYGMNGAGLIVGMYNTPDGYGHGFRYIHAAFQSFDVPFANVHLTIPYAANAVGTIAGVYQLLDGTDHGFTLQNGTYTSLDYPGSIETSATGINDSGEIVGSYTIDGATWHGFLLSGGTYTSFDVPFGGVTTTFPQSINNHNQIVGGYGDSAYYFFGFVASF